MKQSTIITIVVSVVTAGIGFYGGMQYQQSRAKTFVGSGSARQFGSRAGQFGNGNRAGGSRPVTGDILSVDDSSITVKMRDGSSKIVILSSDTSINNAATATKSDLATGEAVMVFGKENTDGSVTAQSIQLNPQQPSPAAR